MLIQFTGICPKPNEYHTQIYPRETDVKVQDMMYLYDVWLVYV